jgi:hypothetical protein
MCTGGDNQSQNLKIQAGHGTENIHLGKHPQMAGLNL